MPEALRTKCVRCTESQKKIAVKIIKRLKVEYPDEWAKLSSKWDPTGDFTRYFEVFLANEQFNTIPDSGNELPISSLPTSRPVPPPPPSTPAPTPETPVTIATPPQPLLLNRFGGEDEVMMGSPSSAAATTRPTPVLTNRPTMRPSIAPRPTPIDWSNVGTATTPTRVTPRPTSELPPPYSTAITFIDQIGIKIIRTTELVTDILKNTVRAMVG
ncbi:unnamed protein product [Euphydryas editha]|uniref:Uncharacterized protein n=1 Tax=Euphydryas editha TaxID=104508 RepID=A0AAU9TVD4_EUPED|nr:unnamed protein product [Euphydryas editha]